MKQNKTFEKYPFSTICITFGQTMLGFFLGAWIMFSISKLYGITYILFWTASLVISMKFRCCYCYYYGKTCSFSLLSRLSKFLFKQGEAAEFQNPKNVYVTAVCSSVVSLMPLIGVIYLDITNFSLVYSLLLIMYLVVAFVINFPIRSNLVCKHCKQGELGCPAFRKIRK